MRRTQASITKFHFCVGKSVKQKQATKQKGVTLIHKKLKNVLSNFYIFQFIWKNIDKKINTKNKENLKTV